MTLFRYRSSQRGFLNVVLRANTSYETLSIESHAAAEVVIDREPLVPCYREVPEGAEGQPF